MLLSVRAADAWADPRPIADAVESSHAGADDAAPDRRAYDVSYAWADAAAYAVPDADADADADAAADAVPDAGSDASASALNHFAANLRLTD